MRRMMILRALIAPTMRAVRRGPFLTAMATGLVVVAVPAALTVDLRADDLATILRIAGVCAGIGLAFLLDDPAKPTVSTVPVPAWLAVLVRTVAGAAFAAGWWLVVLAVTIAGAAAGVGEQIPVGGLSLEAGAMGAVAFAVAVLGWRRAPRGSGSTLAVPALLVVVTAVALLPDRFSLLVAVEDPRWSPAHVGWSVLLAAALALSVAAAVAPRLPLDRTS